MVVCHQQLVQRTSLPKLPAGFRPNLAGMIVTKSVQIMPLGQKWPRPRGHMFCIVLYRENMKQSYLKPQGPTALIFGL